MQIDCYGFEATSQWFKRKTLEPYLIRESEGIIYACFDDSPKRCIHRIDRDEQGSVRIMWAFGPWSAADSLRYVPINETMEIKREDYGK